jgi:anhydro-N-acetylmuramic acid kinase
MIQSTRILGIMSGSSLDGLDLALCRFSGLNDDFSWQLEKTAFRKFPDKWIEKLRRLPIASAQELAQADFDFAYFQAESVQQFIKNSPIDFIASHGHTIFHDPKNKSTYQIGNGGALASTTGIPVISDFRSSDVGLGGQGAPITALFDREFFSEIDFLLNMGGIVNLTVNHPQNLQAFDVGPCNQVLNYLASKAGVSYDKNGNIAQTGQILVELLDQLLAVGYFQRKGPKSLDNTELGNIFFPIFEAHKGAVADKLRTAVEMIVLSIRNSLLDSPGFHRLRSPRLLISGGGAKNTFLVDRLVTLLPEIDLTQPGKNWIDFKEAMMIAYMGYLRLNEKQNVLASVTGADRNSIGGAIYLS